MTADCENGQAKTYRHSFDYCTVLYFILRHTGDRLRFEVEIFLLLRLALWDQFESDECKGVVSFVPRADIVRRLYVDSVPLYTL